MATQKKKILRKYRARRIMLLLLLVAALGSVWAIASRLIPEAPVQEVASTDTNDSTQPDETTDSESNEPLESEELEAAPEAETSDNAELDSWELRLINAWNPLPEDFEVELESVENYQVDTRIVEPLVRMFADAKAVGINLELCSGYRTAEYQQTLLDREKEKYKQDGKTEEEAVAAAAAWIALPGTSEHHTGLAVDIVTPEYRTLDEGFEKTPAFAWLRENAHLYGFIMRYPKEKTDITGISYEPWHYRYVGQGAAGEISQTGYCLEEYLYVKQLEQAKATENEVQEPPVDE